ncbi:MAG: C4-type zinc ribbon domain-containing protein [Coriobacteriales bacterium]|jgi:predicted  nucleic acid-binding Zn-ribbon protein|nr:C4-type zinc ribbon domain-containing protein [Coriobacteriales bacterium]
MQEKQLAQILIALQDIDLKTLRLQKQLDDMPHKRRLLEIKKKLVEVQGKNRQVKKMSADVERTIRLLQDETAHTADQMVQAQKQMDASIDFRESSALGQEMEMLTRRADKLDEDSLVQLEKKDRIDALAAQVVEAIDKLKANEESTIQSYQAEGGAIQHELAALAKTHSALLDSLEPTPRQRYLKAAKAKGGIGASHLEGNQCSGCHVTLSEGQVAKLREGSLVGECPNCGRLMVVD